MSFSTRGPSLRSLLLQTPRGCAHTGAAAHFRARVVQVGAGGDPKHQGSTVVDGGLGTGCLKGQTGQLVGPTGGPQQQLWGGQDQRDSEAGAPVPPPPAHPGPAGEGLRTRSSTGDRSQLRLPDLRPPASLCQQSSWSKGLSGASVPPGDAGLRLTSVVVTTWGGSWHPVSWAREAAPHAPPKGTTRPQHPQCGEGTLASSLLQSSLPPSFQPTRSSHKWASPGAGYQRGSPIAETPPRLGPATHSARDTELPFQKPLRISKTKRKRPRRDGLTKNTDGSAPGKRTHLHQAAHKPPRRKPARRPAPAHRVSADRRQTAVRGGRGAASRAAVSRAAQGRVWR